MSSKRKRVDDLQCCMQADNSVCTRYIRTQWKRVRQLDLLGEGYCLDEIPTEAHCPGCGVQTIFFCNCCGVNYFLLNRSSWFCGKTVYDNNFHFKCPCDRIQDDESDLEFEESIGPSINSLVTKRAMGTSFDPEDFDMLRQLRRGSWSPSVHDPRPWIHSFAPPFSLWSLQVYHHGDKLIRQFYSVREELSKGKIQLNSLAVLIFCYALPFSCHLAFKTKKTYQVLDRRNSTVLLSGGYQRDAIQDNFSE